jgi:hypothetical protein
VHRTRSLLVSAESVREFSTWFLKVEVYTNSPWLSRVWPRQSGAPIVDPGPHHVSRDILEEAVWIRGIWIKATCGETLPEQMTWPGRFWGGGGVETICSVVVCPSYKRRRARSRTGKSTAATQHHGGRNPPLHGLACWWVGEATETPNDVGWRR